MYIKNNTKNFKQQYKRFPIMISLITSTRKTRFFKIFETRIGTSKKK